MKVALVCDWITNVGGAEKVLLELHHLFPKAPIYTSKYDEKGIDWFKGADIRTGWLQKFPTAMRRILGPLRQIYFSRLDLSEYDLIISVTGAEAKAVKSGKWLHENGKKNVKNPNGIHISYCHIPTQYYWQMYDEYINNPGFGVFNFIVRFFFRLFVVPLRKADLKAAKRPDYFITISDYAKEQIKKYYDREATIIHPPVEIKDFRMSGKNSKISDFDSSRYYITTSRQVNWKKIDLAIKACLELKRELVIIGDGPEHKKLEKIAGGSKLIKFLPVMGKKELAKYLVGAYGYLFPSLEPFGIAPVEALAAGCPVIAYGVGGARDYIINGKNGLLFKEQSVNEIVKTILKFEKMKFDRKKIPATAESFDILRFDKEIKDFVNDKTK
ncbi:glycosyltransferase [Candidatus Saccharibacteria bacterium]|nr:glycosyltransferase [Candidatus Saccharibacteria bacterium]